MRKVGHSAIRQFETGLDRIETITMAMIGQLIDDFTKTQGNAFDPKPYLSNTIFNVISQLIVGKTYTRDSEVMQVFHQVQRVALRLVSKRVEGAIMDALPFVEHCYDLFKGVRKDYEEVSTVLLSLMKSEVKKSEEEGFFDSLATKLQTSVDKNELSENNFRMMLIDLLIAGSSTTTNTMYAMFNILLHHRDVQAKLHHEIDSVLGSHQVTLKDRERLPYVVATLQETLRYTTIGPLGIPHCTVKDTHLNHKPIPAGTTIHINLFGMNHDEKHFPDPYLFRPERFLDDTGRFVAADHPNRKNMNAFGAGPRVCFGETLAKNRLFLLVVSLLQHFDIEGDDSRDLVSYDCREYEFKVISQPPTFKVRLTQR